MMQRDVSRENTTLHSLNAWSRLGIWIYPLQWQIQERGPGGLPPAPPYFKTKLRPEGGKKIFLATNPPPSPHTPLSEGLDLPLL